MSLELASDSESRFALAPNDGDRSIVPRFYLRSIKNAERSLADGCPRYDNVEFVKIPIPGDRTALVDEMVTDEHRGRFPAYYERFKRGETQDPGTPLSALPSVDPAAADELAYFGIKSVEQMAALTDGNAKNVTGFIRIRQAARDYLEAAKSAAPAAALRAELDARDRQIEALKLESDAREKRLADMERMIGAMAKPQESLPGVKAGKKG